ncbi:putative acetyl-CoA synthetase [Cavenderia fasciculata]|uniref:medium-chain acyl-CoA ligase n=1 Tax=Cavenderia fasciculata TaxID=261658 RepID=F4PQY1_CACFS|nr:putative acetyl-CoA synthetase [Cavenderia fasciculata]EGG21246.1 putative acetyl-CoA synthetase [Cavenderia fasciculata]|eukprot:XP_004359096.1 putative acetyl-CoA synthetase [Cavenderia fasciculata]
MIKRLSQNIIKQPSIYLRHSSRLNNNNHSNNSNNVTYKYYSSSSSSSSFSSSSSNTIEYKENFIRGDNYDQVYNSFKWSVPEHFNIGYDICDKHLKHKRNHKAIIYEDEIGNIKSITFEELYHQSNQLANMLKKECKLEIGDRIGVLLTQSIETALSHVTAFRSGAISIPLFTLFGPEALSYRLNNSETKCIMTDYDQLEKLLSIQNQLPTVQKIIVFGHPKTSQINLIQNNTNILEWEKIKNNYNDQFEVIKTKSEDPALIIFTSGTTGNPKGCLHAHRVLIGHLPGVQLPQNFFPYHKTNNNNNNNQTLSTSKLCFYTPADWAWIGGLIDVLLPSLYYGVTVLAHRALKFDPVKIADLMIRHKVTSSFLPPTALKMMRQSQHLLPKNTHILSIGSGGESLGDKLLNFGQETFNTTINEFYGQTEANLLVSNSSTIMDVKVGSMGRAVPGHKVEIVSDKGEVLPHDNVGNIALETPDPVSFLRYWNNEKATKSKYVGKWLLTGDLGKKDSDGYFWYVGRDDDIINSSGYRIGPTEIENCIIGHKSVAICAVIGVPCPLRGEVIKAYIVLNQTFQPTKLLEDEIKEHVKYKLAAHEYPRLVEFVESLPMTTTGKIIRKDLRLLHSENEKKKKI